MKKLKEIGVLLLIPFVAIFFFWMLIKFAAFLFDIQMDIKEMRVFAISALILSILLLMAHLDISSK